MSDDDLCEQLGHDDEVVYEDDEGYNWRCNRCGVEGWDDYHRRVLLAEEALRNLLTPPYGSSTVSSMSTTTQTAEQVVAKALLQRISDRDIMGCRVEDVDEEADAETVVAALSTSGHLSTIWHDAGEEVAYRWYLFTHARTTLDQAMALTDLANAMHDLRTHLPGYDYETGTLPFERDEDI